MGKVLIGAALLAGIAAGAAGVAVAQTPPGGPGGQGQGFPPGPPGMGGFGMGPGGPGDPGMGHGGPGGFGPGGFGGPGGPGRPFPGPHGMMAHPPRAAMFAINRGDTRVMIKCSDEESTRACVDAASALLDKIGGGTPAAH